MAKFTIAFVDSSGNHSESVVDAADKISLYNDLKQKGQTLISATEVKSGKGIFDLSRYFKAKVKTKEKIFFARNLGSMIEAGLALSRPFRLLKSRQSIKALRKLLIKLIRLLAKVTA